MAPCSECGSQSSMPFTCKFCSESFCGMHRLPENHDCPGLDAYKEKQQEKREKGEVDDVVYQPNQVKHGTDHTPDITEPRQQPQKPGRSIKEKLKNFSPETLTKNASYTLITATAAISIIAFIFQDLSQVLALHPATEMLLRRPWTVLTSMFIHAGPWHLFINMLALYFFGPELERRIGTRKFVELYFVAGLAGAIGYIAFSQGMNLYMGAELVPAVGASGAVFGVFAATAVVAPEISVVVFPIPVPIKIRTALIGLVLLNLFLLDGTAGIAGSAHLAGIVVGVWYGKRLEDGAISTKYPW